MTLSELFRIAAEEDFAEANADASRFPFPLDEPVDEDADEEEQQPAWAFWPDPYDPNHGEG